MSLNESLFYTLDERRRRRRRWQHKQQQYDCSALLPKVSKASHENMKRWRISAQIFSAPAKTQTQREEKRVTTQWNFHLICATRQLDEAAPPTLLFSKPRMLPPELHREREILKGKFNWFIQTTSDDTIDLVMKFYSKKIIHDAMVVVTFVMYMLNLYFLSAFTQYKRLGPI